MPSSSSSPPSYRSASSTHRIRHSDGSKKASRPSGDLKTKRSTQTSATMKSTESASDPLSNPIDRLRSHYSPEFLKTFAEQRLSTANDVLLDGSKFKFITGEQASSMYEEYMKNTRSGSGNSDQPKRSISKLAPPVVFAFTANDAGRKVVDYYMTWRGKTKTHPLKGLKRRVNFLDHEFNKLSETINKEFNRASQLVQPSSKAAIGSSTPAGREDHPHKATERSKSFRNADRRSEQSIKPENSQSPPPSGTEVGKSEEAVANPLLHPPNRPILGAPRASVISIPFINTTPGEKESDRKKLVITNPDVTSPIITEGPNMQVRSKDTLLEAYTSAETLVGSETGEISTPHTTPETTPERRNSKFSLHSIIKSSRSAGDKARRLTESMRAAKKSTYSPDAERLSKSEPSSDTEMPEMVVAVLDERHRSFPWHTDRFRKIASAISSQQSSVSGSGRSSPWHPSQRSSASLETDDDEDNSSSCSCSSCDEDDDEQGSDGGWQNAPVVPLSIRLQQAQIARSHEAQLSRSQSAYPGWPDSGCTPSTTPNITPLPHYASLLHSPAHMSAPSLYQSPPAMSPIMHSASPHLGALPVATSMAMSSYQYSQPHRSGSQRELDEFARNSPYLNTPPVVMLDMRSPLHINTPISSPLAWPHSPAPSGYYSPYPGRSSTY